MERGDYLAPYRCLKSSAKFKGETTNYVTNFSPATAKPGDTLYVDFPTIKDELVVPNTLALTFDMEVVLDPSTPGPTVRTCPVNNLAANIISDFKVKVGSQYIFELNYSYLYNTYEDLWLTGYERTNKVYNGIQDVASRQLRTDLRTTLEPQKFFTKYIARMYGKRYKLPIDFEVVTNHMPLSGALIDTTLTFEFKVNSRDLVLNFNDEGTANFEMKNICLEFETIRDVILYKEIERELIGGTQFLFDHVHHYKKEEIKKEATFLNIEIQGLDRKSLKGVLLIFEEDFDEGERDSEKFMNPDITSVKYTIDGLPNKRYSNGFQRWNHWDEICKHFMRQDLKSSQLCYMDIGMYYAASKYALWTDLRSTEDNQLHGTGKVHDSKNVIKMEITKENQGIGKYIMHIYVVSDARIIIKDKKLTSFEY